MTELRRPGDCLERIEELRGRAAGQRDPCRVGERIAEVGLELHPDKTRIVVGVGVSM
jgi:hypothetical protein